MTDLHTDHAHGISTIDACYIEPGIASLQLMIENGHAAFFDTGTTLSLPNVEAVLARKGLHATDVDYVIPTHVHLDHAGGAGAMMRAFPNATLIVHPRGASHMIDPGKLWAGTVGVYGEDMARRLYGEVIPVDERRVVTAPDEFELDFHGRRLKFLDTPGHARHHFCIVDTTHRIIFAGDTMGISYRMFDGPNGPFVFPTSSPVQFEPEALHGSIDRLMAADPRAVYVTHFGKIEPSARIVRDLHRHIDDFVALAEDVSEHDNVAAALRPRMADYLLAQAQQHGVPLPDDQIRQGLDMDAKLNADGIAVWLARRETKRVGVDNRG